MFSHIFSPLTSMLGQIGTQIAQTRAGTMLSQLQWAHRTIETASKHAPVKQETNLTPHKPHKLQTQHGDPCNNEARIKPEEHIQLVGTAKCLDPAINPFGVAYIVALWMTVDLTLGQIRHFLKESDTLEEATEIWRHITDLESECTTLAKIINDLFSLEKNRSAMTQFLLGDTFLTHNFKAKHSKDEIKCFTMKWMNWAEKLDYTCQLQDFTRLAGETITEAMVRFQTLWEKSVYKSKREEGPQHQDTITFRALIQLVSPPTKANIMNLAKNSKKLGRPIPMEAYIRMAEGYENNQSQPHASRNPPAASTSPMAQRGEDCKHQLQSPNTGPAKPDQEAIRPPEEIQTTWQGTLASPRQSSTTEQETEQKSLSLGAILVPKDLPQHCGTEPTQQLGTDEDKAEMATPITTAPPAKRAQIYAKTNATETIVPISTQPQRTMKRNANRQKKSHRAQRGAPRYYSEGVLVADCHRCRITHPIGQHLHFTSPGLKQPTPGKNLTLPSTHPNTRGLSRHPGPTLMSSGQPKQEMSPTLSDKHSDTRESLRHLHPKPPVTRQLSPNLNQTPINPSIHMGERKQPPGTQKGFKRNSARRRRKDGTRIYRAGPMQKHQWHTVDTVSPM